MYTHRKVYAHVAKAIGCRALIVHYRRAPENVHPGPVNDMVGNYKWLLDQSIRPDHVALICDSARRRPRCYDNLAGPRTGPALPAATMPLSPWLDMDATGETFETNAAKDLLVTRDIIQTMAGNVPGRRQQPPGPARQSAPREGFSARAWWPREYGFRVIEKKIQAQEAD